MRARSLVLAVLAVLAAGPRVARADDNALKQTDLTKYKLDREKETPLQAGQRFLDDLKAVDPGVASNVLEVARYDIQKEETAKFAHQKTFVLRAYGVLWAILAVFAATLFFRQRKLSAELADLEARVKTEKP
jgi:hypothetical protein